MQLAAYFVISALGVLMKMSLSLFLAKGAYRARMMAAVFSDSVPMTTRSGFMKSWMAAPSLRNSGLETMSKGMSLPRFASSSATTARTFFAVPTGTVDLSTMMSSCSMRLPIPLATSRT